MEAIGVIPARYYSTRFEGKVLAQICGKPMIQHVWERAKKAIALDELLIATEDERVKAVAERLGAKVVLTAKEHKSGTDRLTEAVFSIDAKIIVNIQGDEPLVHPSMIDILVDALSSDKSVQMATLAKRIDDPAQVNDPNVVKVVCDRSGYALYFSRSPIPYPRQKEQAHYYKHIGLYAYTKDFLFTFAKLRVSPLELAEGLEQLRVLSDGYKIKVLQTEYDTISVDTPEDLKKAEALLEK